MGRPRERGRRVAAAGAAGERKQDRLTVPEAEGRRGRDRLAVAGVAGVWQRGRRGILVAARVAGRRLLQLQRPSSFG